MSPRQDPQVGRERPSRRKCGHLLAVVLVTGIALLGGADGALAHSQSPDATVPAAEVRQAAGAAGAASHMGSAGALPGSGPTDGFTASDGGAPIGASTWAVWAGAGLASMLILAASWRWSGERSTIEQVVGAVAVMLLLYAAASHLLEVRPHWEEEWVLGVGFAAAAVLQLVLAVGAGFRSGRGLAGSVATANTALVLLYLTSREVGLPFVAHMDPYRPGELLVVAAELLVVALAVTRWWQLGSSGRHTSLLLPPATGNGWPRVTTTPRPGWPAISG